MSDHPISLASQRKQLRQQRRKLTVFQQKQAERACLSQLIRFRAFQQAQHIGLYLDAFGEIRTQQIISYCLKHKKKIYLPKICSMNQRLLWHPISLHQYQAQRFSRHKLGMLEPMQHRGVAVSKLDLLIMPLLACDSVGMRLGMGGCFYDRTLATAPQKPFRLGLAHDFQFFPEVFQAQRWDQALDALLCPSQIRSFKRHLRSTQCL